MLLTLVFLQSFYIQYIEATIRSSSNYLGAAAHLEVLRVKTSINKIIALEKVTLLHHVA